MNQRTIQLANIDPVILGECAYHGKVIDLIPPGGSVPSTTAIMEVNGADTYRYAWLSAYTAIPAGAVYVATLPNPFGGYPNLLYRLPPAGVSGEDPAIAVSREIELEREQQA